jgi:cysteine desulfurase
MSVYLDHNATSPMHPEVIEAMMPYLQNPVGNPSSLHSYGRMARSAVESARAEVAQLLGCDSAAVIFTSGGTEANNLLLKGYVDHASRRPIISSEIEHSAVLEPLKQLQAEGMNVVLLKPNPQGQVDLEAARSLVTGADAQLLSILYANNETGVIQPVEALAAMVDRDVCLVHSDATQAIGKIPFDLSQLPIDAVSFSAHRQALISGGDQENRRRGGTENVAGIVGLGKAAQIARLEITHKQQYLLQLRESFEARLTAIPGSVIFGQGVPRLPNTTFFALPYYHGETLLMELDRAGFALSSGSACHSMVTEPSHVLKAMGVDDTLALNAIRVSFGMDNSLQDAEQLAAKLQELVDRLPPVIRQAAG